MGHLIEGSVGAEVKNLQRALNYHMPDLLPPLKEDGIFGTQTRKRVVAFQKRRDLEPVGYVGPRTEKALNCFILVQAHIAVLERRSSPPVGGRNVGYGLAPRTTTPVPAMPRLELPYPEPFRWPLPPPVPQLELDPTFLRHLRLRRYELSVGKQVVIQREAGKEERTTSFSSFTDFKGVLWYRGTNNFDADVGIGIGLEHRISPKPGLDVNAFVIARASVKNYLKLGPLDIFRLQAQAMLKRGLRETEFSIGAGGGPVVEIEFPDKSSISFGPSAWCMWAYNGQQYTVSAPAVNLEFTYNFF